MAVAAAPADSRQSRRQPANQASTESNHLQDPPLEGDSAVTNPAAAQTSALSTSRNARREESRMGESIRPEGAGIIGAIPPGMVTQRVEEQEQEGGVHEGYALHTGKQSEEGEKTGEGARGDGIDVVPGPWRGRRRWQARPYQVYALWLRAQGFRV